MLYNYIHTIPKTLLQSFSVSSCYGVYAERRLKKVFDSAKTSVSSITSIALALYNQLATTFFI